MPDMANDISPPTYITKQIRRVSGNLLLWNGLVVGLLFLASAALSTYLICFFRGPQRVDDAFILKAAEGPPSYLIAYVEMHDRQLLPTGYVEESSRNGKVYSTNYYYFVDIGGKLLLVKGTTNINGQKLLGPLESISVKTDQDAVKDMIVRNPNLQNRILPVMLNSAAAFDVFGFVYFGIIIPILAICGYNIVRALLGQRSPALHPVMRSLARYGDPSEVTDAINAELAGDNVLTIGKAKMTRNWLVRPKIFNLLICRIDEIVWAYHAVINGDHVAGLALSNGRVFGIPMQKNTPELLAAIYKRVPWIEKGFDKELQKKWRTRQAEFIADVDLRRKSNPA